MKNTPHFFASAGFDYTATELNINKNFSISRLSEQGRNFCSQSWRNLKDGKTPFEVTPLLMSVCFAAAFEEDLLTFGYRLDTQGIPIKIPSSIGVKLNWPLGVLFNSVITEN